MRRRRILGPLRRPLSHTRIHAQQYEQHIRMNENAAGMGEDAMSIGKPIHHSLGGMLLGGAVLLVFCLLALFSFKRTRSKGTLDAKYFNGRVTGGKPSHPVVFYEPIDYADGYGIKVREYARRPSGGSEIVKAAEPFFDGGGSLRRKSNASSKRSSIGSDRGTVYSIDINQSKPGGYKRVSTTDLDEPYLPATPENVHDSKVQVF